MSYDTPQPGTVWKHFKGELYIVVIIAMDMEPESIVTEIVVYRRFTPNGDGENVHYARTVHNWHQIVRDGVRRFEPHL